MQAILESIEGKPRRGVIHAATGTGKSLVQVEIARLLLSFLRSGERIVISVPSQALVDQMYKDLNERIPARVRKWYQYERKLDRPIIVACHKSMMEGIPRCLTCRPLKPSEIARRKKAKLPLIPLEGSALRMTRQALRCGHDNVVLCPKPNSLGVAMMRKGLRVRFWVADEIHQTENLRVLAWASMMRPAARIGFTATPFRTQEKQAISLFDDLLLSYGIQEAIADKVIVPPRFVSYSGEDRDVDRVCIEMIQDLLDEQRGQCVGIVNAWDCEDADYYAAMLREHGIRAESIHSRHRKDKQRDKLRKLRRGYLDCLVHVNLLSEGRNFPWLRWLCLRRSTRRYNEEGDAVFATMSRTRYIQEVGRILRKWDGKEEAIILDPSGLSTELQLFYEERLGVAEETPTIVIRQRKKREQDRQRLQKEREEKRLLQEGIVLMGEPLAEKSQIGRWLLREGTRMRSRGMLSLVPPPSEQEKREGVMRRRDPLVKQYVLLHQMMPALPSRFEAMKDKGLVSKLQNLLVLALRKRLTREQMHVFLGLLVHVR